MTWAHAPGRGKLSERDTPWDTKILSWIIVQICSIFNQRKNCHLVWEISQSRSYACFPGRTEKLECHFNDEVDIREWEVTEDNLENMVTPEEFTEVYQSDVSTEARKLLEEYQLEDDLVTRDSVLVRNYLASIYRLQNAGRAGNFINLTLGAFLGGKIDSKTRDIIINVMNHKTKRKNGPAQIVLTAVLYRQMRSYLSIYRSDVAKMNSCDAIDPYIKKKFTWSFKHLKGLSKQLNSFWGKALKTNRECPISATLDRKSFTTVFYAKEDTTDILNRKFANHMKHKPETAAKKLLLN